MNSRKQKNMNNKNQARFENVNETTLFVSERIFFLKCTFEIVVNNNKYIYDQESWKIQKTGLWQVCQCHLNTFYYNYVQHTSEMFNSC